MRSVWVAMTMPGLGLARAADGRLILALHVDHAHPARSEAGQLGLVAESGHLDAVVAADLEDGLAIAARELPAVDLDCEGGRGQRTLRRLRLEQLLDRARRGLRQRCGAAYLSCGHGLLHSWSAPYTCRRHSCGERSGLRTRLQSSAVRTGTGWVPAAPGRTVPPSRTSAARSSSSCGSVGRARPLVAREPISYIRRTPMRHGMVLPHDSSERKRVISVAMSTRQVRVVRHDERAGAHDRAFLLECPRRVGGQQFRWRQEAAGRAADQDGLQLAARAHTATDFFDQPTHRHARRNLGDAGLGHAHR